MSPHYAESYIKIIDKRKQERSQLLMNIKAMMLNFKELLMRGEIKSFNCIVCNRQQAKGNTFHVVDNRKCIKCHKGRFLIHFS